MRSTTLAREGTAEALALPRRGTLCHSVPDATPPSPMTRYHVLAAAGDSADELRSVGLHDAASARDALIQCLAELDDGPIAEYGGALRDPELAELLRREQQQLRDALAEPDVSFMVTPVRAEAHFVRDHGGEVKPEGVDAAGAAGGRVVVLRSGGPMLSNAISRTLV